MEVADCIKRMIRKFVGLQWKFTELDLHHFSFANNKKDAVLWGIYCNDYYMVIGYSNKLGKIWTFELQCACHNMFQWLQLIQWLNYALGFWERKKNKQGNLFVGQIDSVKEVARHPRMSCWTIHSVSKEMHHEFIGFRCDPGSRSSDPGRVSVTKSIGKM